VLVCAKSPSVENGDRTSGAVPELVNVATSGPAVFATVTFPKFSTVGASNTAGAAAGVTVSVCDAIALDTGVPPTTPVTGPKEFR
jgi:hypothetical protein